MDVSDSDEEVQIDGGGRTVLLVDDEAELRRILGEVLKSDLGRVAKTQRMNNEMIKSIILLFKSHGFRVIEAADRR